MKSSVPWMVEGEIRERGNGLGVGNGQLYSLVMARHE